MSDAWLYATRRDAAWDLGLGLAELGYSPRYLETGALTPPGDANGPARRPELAVVVVARGEEPGAKLDLIDRLRHSGELDHAPVLLALEQEHLASDPELAAAHELLVRPFSVDELRARVARATANGNREAATTVVGSGVIQLNLATHEVTVASRPVAFTRMEFDLLRFLLTHPNRAYSREALLTCVWGYDYYGGERTVDVHVRRLRAKLGAGHAERIRTVRSVGYLFDSREPARHLEPEAAFAVG